MNDEKGSGANDFEAASGESAEDKRKTTAASRARNRTVMLTPEMTGHVRALLQKDPDAAGKEAGHSDPLEDLLPPLNEWDNPPESAEYARGGKEHGGFEKAPAKFGREEPERRGESAADWESPRYESGGFSAAPSGQDQTRHSPTAEHKMEADADQHSRYPSFSVNRAAPARVAAATPAANPQRAPRTPVEASGRYSPVSISGEKTKIVAFLISFDKDKVGEVFEIRAGRWLVTSRPTDHGDYILIADDSISPLHAILRATKDGKVQVLDQLSEFGTGVYRSGSDQKIEIAGGLETVNHGDIVRFGERYFVVCIVPDASIVAKLAEYEHKSE